MNDNHYDIDTIKDRIKIWDVMRHFGHDVGDRCKAVKSPLREDRSPSFSIFANGNAAKDHSTGMGYDVISLYQELAGVSKHEAIVGCGRLAQMGGGSIPQECYVPPPPRSTVAAKQKDDSSFVHKLGELNQDVLDLMKAKAHAMLAGKGNMLTQFCAAKKFDHAFMATMIDQGLVGVLESPHLREPVITWIFHNSIHGYGCKIRFKSGTSHSTMWWHGKSSEHFFGEQLVKPLAIDDQDRRLILTEGESDCLTMLQMGIPALGMTGAGVLPTMQVTHAMLGHRTIGVWYDSDQAGRDATEKVQHHILQHASGATVIRGIGSKVPDGMDIGDCHVKYGKKFENYAKKEFDLLETIN